MYYSHIAPFAITSEDDLPMFIFLLFALFLTVGLQRKQDENSVHLSLCFGNTVPDDRW